MKFNEEKDSDLIIVENGNLFEGTRSQFRDCFFDNANNGQIIAWCIEQHYTSLKIRDKVIPLT